MDELWRTQFVALVDYLVEHGNCNVPLKQGSLGSWVNDQRQSYKIGRMSQFQYRIKYLESIGFAWELKRDGKWLPDRPEPNLKTIARVIKEEQGTPVARALRLPPVNARKCTQIHEIATGIHCTSTCISRQLEQMRIVIPLHTLINLINLINLN